MTKAFSIPALGVRIRVVILGRVDTDDYEATSLSCGAMDVNLVHHEVRVSGTNVALTTKEFEVLVFLTRHAGKTCTNHMILSAVWGSGYGTEAPYVHAYAHPLRQKLSDDSGELLQNVPGIGYLLHCEPATQLSAT